MSFRIQQINSLISGNISEILLKEISLKPGIFVSVTKVDTSKDLRYTHIFVSVFPIDQTAYVQATLHKELFRIQGALNKKLHIKRSPRISFYFDETQENVSQIEKIFEEIRKEKE
jgi:ribosome-binding factor A